MPPEKTPNCDPKVLKILQDNKTMVTIVRRTGVKKVDKNNPEERESQHEVIKIPIQDIHVTGCRIIKEEGKKDRYSVTTIDGQHYKGDI